MPMKIKYLFSIALVLVLAGCAQEEPAAPVEGAAPEESAPAAEAPVLPDPAEVAARVAAADPEMGKRQYIFCQACHSTNSGGANKVGPNLFGFIDRPAGQAAGFVYSEPLTSSGLVWDLAVLDAWIENPGKVIPGTTMVFGGIKDPLQRANLIAYLQQATQ